MLNSKFDRMPQEATNLLQNISGSSACRFASCNLLQKPDISLSLSLSRHQQTLQEWTHQQLLRHKPAETSTTKQNLATPSKHSSSGKNLWPVPSSSGSLSSQVPGSGCRRHFTRRVFMYIKLQLQGNTSKFSSWLLKCTHAHASATAACTRALIRQAGKIPQPARRQTVFN